MGYLIQCPELHIWEVREGSALEEKCIAREQEGFIDALPISTSECPDCAEEGILSPQRSARICVDARCPVDDGEHGADDCERNGCEYARSAQQLRANRPAIRDMIAVGHGGPGR